MTQKYVSVFILFLFCFYRVVCQFFCIISQSPSNLPTLRFRILIHVRESRRLLNVSKCMHTTRGGGQIRLGIYSRFFLLFHPSLCVCVGFQVVVRLVTRAPVCVFGIRVFQFNGLKHLESNIFLYIISVNFLSIFFSPDNNNVTIRLDTFYFRSKDSIILVDVIVYMHMKC
jgi:hypothetical protein